jgi:hypothetical protein
MAAAVTTPRTIPIYWIIVTVATVVFSPVFAILASVQIAEANADRQRQEQIEAQARAQAESRKVVCGWLSAYLDTFDETPPTSDTGRNLRAKFLDLYQISQCSPVRR